MVRHQVGVPQRLFTLSVNPGGLHSMLSVLVSIRVTLGKLHIKEVRVLVAPFGQLSDALVSLHLVESVGLALIAGDYTCSG